MACFAIWATSFGFSLPVNALIKVPATACLIKKGFEFHEKNYWKKFLSWPAMVKQHFHFYLSVRTLHNWTSWPKQVSIQLITCLTKKINHPENVKFHHKSFALCQKILFAYSCNLILFVNTRCRSFDIFEIWIWFYLFGWLGWPSKEGVHNNG